MGKYPFWNCRKLERRLKEIGCELLRTFGSHRHYSNPFRADRLITCAWHPDNALDHGDAIEEVPAGQPGLLGLEKVLARRHARSGWPVALTPIAREARRRFATSKISDREFYGVEAQRAGRGLSVCDEPTEPHPERGALAGSLDHPSKRGLHDRMFVHLPDETERRLARIFHTCLGGTGDSPVPPGHWPGGMRRARQRLACTHSHTASFPFRPASRRTGQAGGLFHPFWSVACEMSGMELAAACGLPACA